MIFRKTMFANMRRALTATFAGKATFIGKVAWAAAAVVLLPGAGTPTMTDEPIVNPAALSSYFKAQASDTGVRVLQLGDSHIARDTFSGDLRTLLGADGMPGARGMLPAGLVYPFLSTRGVELDMSTDWEIFPARAEDASGPFGMMSARIVARAGTAPWIALSGFELPVDRLLLGYWRQPTGGVIQVRVDGRLHAIPTHGEAGPAFAAVPVSMGAQIIRIAAAGNGDVTLLSLLLEAEQEGAVLTNAGWPGATAELMAAWDDDVLRLELQQLRPNLIIISYGTNEGFDDELDIEAYTALLKVQLERLKRFAPQASLLLTGGPDGTRLPFYADTDAREPDEWACVPLNDDERQAYVNLLGEKSEVLLRWHAPPKLDEVFTRQRSVAAELGVAHWNWRKAMGGECSVHAWRFAEDPQLARPDHVHLTGEGYALSAQSLKKALDGAFVAWMGDREGVAVP